MYALGYVYPQVEQETSMIGSDEGLHMTIDPFMADVVSK